MCLLVLLSIAQAGRAQNSSDPFRWMDFHSDKDQSVVIWVTRALGAEKWTSIREIGVQYDAALVVTTERSGPEATPGNDTFQIWSVSLTSHVHTPLLKGVNLRWLDWLAFSDGAPREIGVLYDDCRECAATTYFTTFHYDFSQHIFIMRWQRGGQGAPVWTSATPEGVQVTQVYAVLSDPDGRQLVGTWNHYDYGKQKPIEDYIYRYDRDPYSGLDRTQLLSGRDADAMKQRICLAQANVEDMAKGQASDLCLQTVHKRPERGPVTTPPANNQGRSVPPGTRR